MEIAVVKGDVSIRMETNRDTIVLEMMVLLLMYHTIHLIILERISTFFRRTSGKYENISTFVGRRETTT